MTAASEGETFLQRRLRIKAEQEALERGTDPWSDAPATGDVEAGHPRAQRWVEAKVAAQLAEVAGCPEGTRNDHLNHVAYSLGRLAPKWVDPKVVGPQLVDAAQTSGLPYDEALATVRSGMRAGMDEPRDPPIRDDAEAASPDPFDELVNVDTGEIVSPAAKAGELERTTWWPIDLRGVLAGDIPPEPEPAFLAREDGRRLFYAGRVNALIGESESGKTWVGLLAVAQALWEGVRVLVLDFEDTVDGIIQRLRWLGCTDEHLALLAYISPDETFGTEQQRDLVETLNTHRPGLILFDGVNAAMTMLGLDLEKNKDSTDFSIRVLRPLKRTGACVVTVDHVTKSKEGRGNYAIGAQAKRADVDGCGLMVEVVAPFGMGGTGRLKLVVSKDRRARVRAVSAGAKNAGTAVLVGSADGSVKLTIEAPDLRPADERGPFRPTHLMERVSMHLETLGDGEYPSRTAVKLAVKGNNEHVLTSIDRLIEEGFARIEQGGVRSVKPFREHS